MSQSFEELDKLSSHELRTRAFELAKRRHDVRFFWHLLKDIPAAEEAEGHPEKLAEDVESSRGWLADYLHPDGPMEDALRPVFLEYLEKHGP